MLAGTGFTLITLLWVNDRGCGEALGHGEGEEPLRQQALSKISSLVLCTDLSH